MKKYLLLLLFTCLVSFSVCIAYTVMIDAETVFWRSALEKKLKYSNKISDESTHKLVFIGGSSCTFSIRPDILDAHGIHAVNMGLHAGFGARVNSAVGLEVLSSNDVLIVCIEPDQLTQEEITTPALGKAVSLAVGKPGWVMGGRIAEQDIDWKELIFALRPGGRRVVTMVSKALLGRPMYRYSQDEMSNDGWSYTSYSKEHAVAANAYEYEKRLSISGRELLQALRDYCETRNIYIYYVIPWQLTEAEALEDNRLMNRGFLCEINEIIPVIYDEYYGCSSNQSFYADTAWHMTPEGSAAKTESFANSFKRSVGSLP